MHKRVTSFSTQKVANDARKGTGSNSPCAVVGDLLRTNQENFLQRLTELYAANVEISRRKNSDYANKEDPFQNFRACEIYGISLERGLIVRMSDKMTRISNLLTRPAQVADESVLDTLSDLANYAMILRMALEQKHGN
jgi:hypothetical protein